MKTQAAKRFIGSLVIGAVIVVILGNAYLALMNKKTAPAVLLPDSQWKINGDDFIILGQKSQDQLETATYKAINQRALGRWDKIWGVSSVHTSGKAAEGYWFYHDRWDWIAWRGTGDDWTVLVSMDGFDCTEAKKIPPTYTGFFKSILYRFGKEYCLPVTSGTSN